MKEVIALAGALSIASLATSHAQAQTEETSSAKREARFGDAGQWVITGGSSLSAFSTLGASDDYSGHSYDARLGFHHFVVDHFSVGLAFDFGATEYKEHGPTTGRVVEDKSSFVGGAVVFGYDVPLGRVFSLWSRAGVSFDRWTYSTGYVPPGAPDEMQKGHIVRLDFSVYLLAHPAPHFFLGIGPALFTDLARTSDEGLDPSGGHKITNVGLETIVGGWL